MQDTRKITGKILIAATLVAMLFVFGTQAHANVTASPAILNFGSQAVGTTSEPIAVTLTNNSRHRITILSVSSSMSQFSHSGPSLPITLTRGERLTISVTFRPATARSYAGTLVFERRNGTTTSVALRGSSGSSSHTATQAIPPTIMSQPVGRTVTAGQSASFSVGVTGTAPLTYQWSKNSAEIDGATSSSYTIPAATTSDSGAQFTISVSNKEGRATSTPAILMVTGAAAAPSITTQPLSKIVTAGQKATFSVSATGTAPMMFQWMKNGTAVSGATSSSYTTPATTSSDNFEQFTVGVSNSVGKATSTAATLTVNGAAAAPAITTQPIGQTVGAGQMATFSVLATGAAPMTYQWKKNGTAISGATSSTYTTPAEIMADNGAQFTAAVSNSAGNATSTAAILTVNAAATPPAIATQPTNQTIAAGQKATFMVSATGTAPMTYQWKKNGTAISGATSSTYTTPAEIMADNGAKFTAAVSNSAGNATSTAATLTVNPTTPTTPTTLALNASSTALSFGNVNVSTSSSQNVTLTNAGNSNITVSNVSVAGAGFNATGLSSGLILTPGQTATLSATFTPAASGSVTGSVTVASNASNSPDTIALSGFGVTQANHSVNLSWSPSTSTVAGYYSYSSTTSGGPYTKLSTTPVSTTNYTDTAVQAGHTYYYVVTAVDSNSVESAFSTEVSANIP